MTYDINGTGVLCVCLPVPVLRQRLRMLCEPTSQLGGAAGVANPGWALVAAAKPGGGWLISYPMYSAAFIYSRSPPFGDWLVGWIHPSPSYATWWWKSCQPPSFTVSNHSPASAISRSFLRLSVYIDNSHQT